MQSWKQLSRFQRSLLYMVVGVALVVAVFYYFNLDGGLVRERKARLNLTRPDFHVFPL